jgi:hypothetical protein
VVNEDEVAAGDLTDPQVQKRIAAQDAVWEGSQGALLLAVSAADGKTLAEHKLDALPTWDGMAAADGCLYLSTTDGRILCLSGKR